MKSKNIWFVEFYLPREQPSKAYKEKFIKLATSIKQQGVRVGAVNCEAEKNLCNQHVKNRPMPIFMVVSSQGELLVPQKGSDPPAPKALLEFLVEHAPGDVLNMRQLPQADEFVSKTCSDKKKAALGAGVILFTSKFDTSLLIKSLAHTYRTRLAVAEVRASNDKLAKEFGLGNKPAYPILVIVCTGSEKMANLVYEGDLKKSADVEKFLESKLGGKRSADTCKTLHGKAKKERERRSKQGAGISKLSDDELKKKPIKELREIVDDLGLKSEGLLEKADYVQAIRNHVTKTKTEL